MDRVRSNPVIWDSIMDSIALLCSSDLGLPSRRTCEAGIDRGHGSVFRCSNGESSVDEEQLLMCWYTADVNECVDQPGVCQQVCRNTWGSFYCSCHDGYQLQADSITCTGASFVNHLLYRVTQVYRKFKKTPCVLLTLIASVRRRHFQSSDCSSLAPYWKRRFFVVVI